MIPLDCVEGESVSELIRSIQRLPGARRTRLLAVAFCDRVAHLLQHDICREWLEVARRYADKQACRVDMAKAHSTAKDAYDRFGQPTELGGLAIQSTLRAFVYTLHPARRYYAQVVANASNVASRYAAGDRAGEIGFGFDPLAYTREIAIQENAIQLRLLRDVLGRPDDVLISAIKDWLGWQGGQVPKLARGIYEDRVFDRMPVLGDALEDAGCAEEAILAHCRGPGPHTRGCWVVDMLLGLG
jgi:hypothetical protein